jgi:hypothetical protein
MHNWVSEIDIFGGYLLTAFSDISRMNPLLVSNIVTEQREVEVPTEQQQLGNATHQNMQHNPTTGSAERIQVTSDAESRHWPTPAKPVGIDSQIPESIAPWVAGTLSQSFPSYEEPESAISSYIWNDSSGELDQPILAQPYIGNYSEIYSSERSISDIYGQDAIFC